MPIYWVKVEIPRVDVMFDVVDCDGSVAKRIESVNRSWFVPEITLIHHLTGVESKGALTNKGRDNKEVNSRADS